MNFTLEILFQAPNFMTFQGKIGIVSNTWAQKVPPLDCFLVADVRLD